jgi:cutinase
MKSAACPRQKFALVGYSQGGLIVKAVLRDIPSDIAPKVVAVVLYGATDGSDQSPSSYKAKTLANCAPGDFVRFIFFGQ